MTAPSYAWRCLRCPERGTGPKSDLAARKHTEQTGHHTTTHLDGPRSGWCNGPDGAKPPHARCRVAGCSRFCHKEAS